MLDISLNSENLRNEKMFLSINISCLRHFFRQTHKRQPGSLRVALRKLKWSTVVTYRDSRRARTDLSDKDQTLTFPKGLIRFGVNSRRRSWSSPCGFCAEA